MNICEPQKEFEVPEPEQNPVTAPAPAEEPEKVPA